MSKQYPGGLITKSPVTPSGPYSTDSASGIWTLDQQAYWQKLGQWPNANNPPLDPQFNYVTMLLHGDGTNGAQNNTFLDSSTNNFTITRNGNTTQGSFSPYGSNWSNFFNGTDSWFTFTGTTTGSGDFTIESWVFLPVLKADDVIFDNRASTSSATGLAFALTVTGAPYVYTNNAVLFTSTQLVSVTTWTHVALVRSGSTLTIYVNGVSGGTASSSANFSDTSNGIGIAPSFTSTTKFNGYISNLRVVNGTAVYTSTFTPSTTPLTAITNTSLLTCQSNSFKDNSTNNFTLTVVGTPSVQRFNPFGTSTAYSTSVIGGSGYFDGSGDSLSLPNDVALDFGTGNFTIEVWIYPTSLPTSYQCVFITCNNVGSAGGIGLFTQSTGEIEVYDFVGNGAVFSTSGFNLKTNQWTNIAVTRSGSTNTLYKNGVSFATATNSSNYNSSTDTVIGNSTTASQTFYGYISALRVLKGTAQAPTITTPPTNITNTSLLLNMTNGAIFDNAMMNDLETVGNAQISTSVKKYGTGSLAFDGTGDYLIPPSGQNVTFGTGNFTIEGWFYWNSLASESAIMWGNGVGWTFYIYPANKLQWGTTSPQASANLLTGSTTLATGQWYHIAVTRASNTVTLWVNGVSDGTVTDSNNYSANGRLAIGISHSNEYFNGYMDDVRITKGVARYTATFTPPTQAFFDYGPT